jgi:hypothetical protein
MPTLEIAVQQAQYSPLRARFGEIALRASDQKHALQAKAAEIPHSTSVGYSEKTLNSTYTPVSL